MSDSQFANVIGSLPTAAESTEQPTNSAVMKLYEVSVEQQRRIESEFGRQNLTAWPITIDGKEHAIRISKAGNPVCDCGTASNHPHHIPAKTLENAFPPDHEIFKALPPSRLAELAKLEVEQEANELRFRLAEAERQQKERAERERLCLKFPGLNSHGNYKHGKPLPPGLVWIPTDNSIRRIKKAGIEYREIVELVYTGRRHVPRVRGYAVRESDWLLVQCNFDHEEILKVVATESKDYAVLAPTTVASQTAASAA